MPPKVTRKVTRPARLPPGFSPLMPNTAGADLWGRHSHPSPGLWTLPPLQRRPSSQSASQSSTALTRRESWDLGQSDSLGGSKRGLGREQKNGS